MAEVAPKIQLTLDELDFLIERGVSLGNELAVIRCVREACHDYHSQLVEMKREKDLVQKKYEVLLQLIARRYPRGLLNGG